jgi:hypothetical protein
MNFLAVTGLALGGVMLVSGCGGGTGPATPFNPFGTDPSGGASEPTGGSNEMPPSGGQGTQSVAQLCVDICARIEASCPGYASANCASGCSQSATEFPNCQADLEAFLSCAGTASLTCTGQSVQVPSCMASELSLESCEASGTRTTPTAGAT